MEEERPEQQPQNPENAASSENKTPFLDTFGKDLTKLAEDGKLDPISGREKEILQVLLILARKKKNNPVIIGEPGVGKTALVEGIAQMIVNEDECPEAVQGKRIVYIDMGSLIAGASKQGEFEKRIKALLVELEKNQDIILFIDEIHMMVNPSMAIDAANMFKPALARGDMRLIGATTLNEFRNSIEKDGALDRRFQKVIIEPPTVQETIEILNKLKPKYEEFHKVVYSKEAIDACVNFSDKYMTDRFFPDKAIDLMDEVGARSRVLRGVNESPEIKKIIAELKTLKNQKNQAIKDQDFPGSARFRQEEKTKLEKLGELRAGKRSIEITAEDVAQIVSAKTGVPVEKFTEDEGQRLLGMEKELKLQVIGQDEAVGKIAKCIRRNRVGLKNKKRPQGVFLFLGSTGTGKTHTVKTLAKYLFGTEDAMIRVDMSEYGEKHNVSRMVGSPPGYVGYGEGGQLTEKVRRKPYSIVLFDEIEKAHPDVLNIMLQIFDEGHLTDGQGRKVNFKNTIIVMTSNIGSRAIRDMGNVVGGNPGASFGFKTKSVLASQSPEEISRRSREIIKKELHEALAPEFINRIDDIIIFKSLGKDNIYRIIDIEMGKVAKTLAEMDIKLSMTDNVKDFLIEKGYDEEMGARPLGRAIQTYIEDPIADEILRKKIKNEINLDFDKEKGQLLINGEAVEISEKFKNRFIKRFPLLVETKFSGFTKIIDGINHSRPRKK